MGRVVAEAPLHMGHGPLWRPVHTRNSRNEFSLLTHWEERGKVAYGSVLPEIHVSTALAVVCRLSRGTDLYIRELVRVVLIMQAVRRCQPLSDEVRVRCWVSPCGVCFRSVGFVSAPCALVLTLQKYRTYRPSTERPHLPTLGDHFIREVSRSYLGSETGCYDTFLVVVLSPSR
jgi:hypothetical protein